MAAFAAGTVLLVPAIALMAADYPWLAVIYKEGNFYLGRTSLTSNGNLPVTDLVTQDTDFGQVEPWLASWNGASRHELDSDAASEATAREVEDADQVYVLIPDASGAKANSTWHLEHHDDDTTVSAEVAVAAGLFKVDDAPTGKQLKLKLSAAPDDPIVAFVLIGPTLGD